MATWNKKEIEVNGTKVMAQAPEIISASRSTDIPAFYADWFFHRLKEGYSAWTNPFNGVKSYVCYDNTRFIVFWSKNPVHLLPYLDYLKDKGIGCYIQFSLNDYENEGLEKGVPPLAERIATFKALVDKIGFGGVIWRFDPLVLTDTVSINDLLRKIENIGDQLKGYTEKLVFSFCDISIYRKVKNNLDNSHINYREWCEDDMQLFAKRLVTLNKEKNWNYKLATCGEAANLEGIEHNHCIDDELIIKRAYTDNRLMDFLKAKVFQMPQPNLFGDISPLPPDAILLKSGKYAIRGNNKDNGQREFCGCMRSKDIGEYNTCVHMCEYCYANASKQAAAQNYNHHKENPFSDTITGK